MSSDSSICPQTVAKKHDKHTPVTQIHINVCKQKIICHIVLLCCLATDLTDFKVVDGLAVEYGGRQENISKFLI